MSKVMVTVVASCCGREAREPMENPNELPTYFEVVAFEGKVYYVCSEQFHKSDLIAALRVTRP